MEFNKLTKEYYSHWLGINQEVLNETGVYFIESSERDVQQIGYPAPVHLFVYYTENLIVLSYSKQLKNEIQELSEIILNHLPIEALIQLLEEKIKRPLTREIKFYYQQSMHDAPDHEVVKLGVNDYDNYLTFFKTQHPQANAESWLHEYFEDLCANETVFGIMVEGQLASVSDTPDMPYMSDKIQEIGINTLEDYRRKGYAKSVVQASIQSIISNDKSPIWSCLYSNKVSEHLAYQVGFEKLADVLKITL